MLFINPLGLNDIHSLCFTLILNLFRRASPLVSRRGGGCVVAGEVFTARAGPEGGRKLFSISLYDNAIGTKHIGVAPHQNYDPMALLKT